MRIGVVGDTHNRIPNVERIIDLFRIAAVERVVHTGDITQPKVLACFARLGVPIVGVFGNNDLGERDALLAAAKTHGMDFLDPPRTIEWSRRRILIAHDPEEVATALDASVDLVLHGHTHRHRLEQRGQTLFFNPGECAGMQEGRNAIGVIDLASLDAELLHF